MGFSLGKITKAISGATKTVAGLADKYGGMVPGMGELIKEQAGNNSKLADLVGGIGNAVKTVTGSTPWAVFQYTDGKIRPFPLSMAQGFVSKGLGTIIFTGTPAEIAQYKTGGNMPNATPVNASYAANGMPTKGGIQTGNATLDGIINGTLGGAAIGLGTAIGGTAVGNNVVNQSGWQAFKTWVNNNKVLVIGAVVLVGGAIWVIVKKPFSRGGKGKFANR
ncbi:hypothetical protein KJK34_04680 [Flavobacterium sp. D11R37]|uniref:hypothetical protein n=1 Tax=Flavobacterium coralii TaxID=2838017 RepID=UPI001CA7A578|nr:hypothetical protein [Flavobacterium coralii]MBY8962042.1 hypothetical protein [Flavobacterium coralii]